MVRFIFYIIILTTTLHPCRLWCLISIGNQNVTNNESDLDYILSEANYFQELGSDYDTWSLFYYNQELELVDLYRSEISSDIDTNYQNFLDQILNEENNAKIIGGHLRNPTSGAFSIPNPHPFLFNYNNKSYSLIHNGTISKSILLALLTENNSDSTWINNNPPNTFNNENWHSDSGWVNVVDSELLLFWIMKNIDMNEGTELESIIYSIQQLEAIHPNGEKNFIFSDGIYTYAYRSEDDELPDLYYSDLTTIINEDTTYTPNFISIMSEIPYNSEATQLNWTAFENESLMILNNEGDYIFISDFVNHSPQFELPSLNDTLWILNDYSILLTAIDIDEDSLFYSIENNPTWINMENQNLNVYPEELGIYNFQVIVNDGELEDILNVSFNIVDYRPIIVSITDIPDDNGGWVYINFLRSFYDTGEMRNTEIYHVERLTGENWISVGSSAAYGSESYTVQVMTEIDSSNGNSGISYFRVLSSMDEGLWISEIDSGISVNNNNLELLDTLLYPIDFSLLQNYPNPFNPSTSLRYDLPEDALVNITIYDMMGRQVKSLINDQQKAGYKSIRWNATNDRNEPVSAGLYLYTIQAGEFRHTKKMVLLK